MNMTGQERGRRTANDLEDLVLALLRFTTKYLAELEVVRESLADANLKSLAAPVDDCALLQGLSHGEPEGERSKPVAVRRILDLEPELLEDVKVRRRDDEGRRRRDDLAVLVLDGEERRGMRRRRERELDRIGV